MASPSQAVASPVVPVEERDARGSMRGMQASTPHEEDLAAPQPDTLGDRPLLSRPIAFVRAHREQLLYLVVGFWNTVFGYAVWAVMQYLLGDRLHYLAIVLLSWPIAVLNAYLCYRYIVFRSRGPIRRELPRFSMVYVASLLATLVVLPIALHVLPLSIYVIQAAFTAILVVASYLAHKHFSFRGGRRAAGPSH